MFSGEYAIGLPDLHYMLHDQAYDGNPAPAGCPDDNRFSTGLDELHHIAVQSNSRHRHNDHKFGQFFEGLKYRSIYSHM